MLLLVVWTRYENVAPFQDATELCQELFDKVPKSLDPNVTGWLVYDSKRDFPHPTVSKKFEPFDDFGLIPLDRREIYDQVDQSITLDITMNNLGDGAN